MRTYIIRIIRRLHTFSNLCTNDWPGMDRNVERFISECETCRRGTVRRRHLKMIFDADAPLARALPRQHYGLDFYGVLKGEI